MKKSLKKLSVILIFSLAVLLSSCDPVFNDTFKVRNEFGRDIKAVNNTTYDTIVIHSGKVEIADELGGIGISQFENTSEYLHRTPLIIFDDTIVYTINDLGFSSVADFNKSIFKKSCWEILEANDKSNSYEVLYTITEEDYQNALILNGMNK